MLRARDGGRNNGREHTASELNGGNCDPAPSVASWCVAASERDYRVVLCPNGYGLVDMDDDTEHGR